MDYSFLILLDINETIAAILMLNKNTKVEVHSPDGDWLL